MSNLIIVESPTKAKTLGRFLGSEWVVDSTLGHIRDLPKSKIGVDVEKNFKPDYVEVSGKSETITRLKKEAAKADNIYLATDPDREGEAISWHTFEVLKLPKNKTKRVVFHEITEEAVREAIASPREINMQLVDAQQARRVLDRLVGYKLSPLLWKKIRRGLSAGRVQSVVVRLIVEKEREIEVFKPVEYWDISANVANTKEFQVKLIKIEDEKAVISIASQAEEIVGDLNKATYKIGNIERREVIKKPFAPFTTSTMTQAASRLFYWSAKKTMSVAQRLYEEGLITYHRTDSTNIALPAISMVRTYIQKEYPKEYLPEKPRIYKTSSKMAQEAHEAIRPTNINLQSTNNLGSDGRKLYELIWKRFLSCQMSDALFDETKIDVSARFEQKFYTLRASGQIIKFQGWKVLFKGNDQEVIQLPEVQENEALQLIKVDGQQKFTESPARFTEASLVKTLEKLGIGRPSTYAPTISTIQDRQYVEKNEGKFSPTSLGIAVCDFLVENFPDIFDLDFTAQMEKNLDEIASGEEKWVPVISKFWEPLIKKLDSVDKKVARVKIETEETGNKCPLCVEGDEIIRVGKFGKFLSCSNFPNCKYTAAFIEKIDVKCPACVKGEVIVKKTRHGKKFFGCSLYPECKWATWKKPDIQIPTQAL